MQNEWQQQQWIVEEVVGEGVNPPVTTSFSNYEEAYSFYVSKCLNNPDAQISIRKVNRQLLTE